VPCLAAAAPAAAPFAPQELADPSEALAPFLVQLEKLRVMAVPQPERVGAIAKDALAALANLETGSRESLARVDEAIAKEPRKQPTRLQAADRQRLRIHLAQAALARGDLYRLAALALPKDHADRAANLERAVLVFEALRVEYRDLAVSFMGYIGEARAQRASGNFEAAYATLKPVFGLATDAKDSTSLEIRRAGALELLEVHLAADPRKALAEAATQTAGALFKDALLWQARIDYVVARAEAADLEKAASTPPLAPDFAQRLAKAATLLRRDTVVEIAPSFDRSATLATLDRLAGGSLLARDELIAWADLLAATERPGALDAYRRAGATAPLPVEQSVVYASLLMKQNALADVAAVCDDVLKRMDPAHAQRSLMLQFRAAALLKLLDATKEAAPASLRTRAADALRAVVESTLDPAVRRDALRQWVTLQGMQAGLGSCVAVLQANPALTAGDPYLEYSLAAGKWQRLRDDAAAGADETVAMVQARSIVEEAAALEKAAAQRSQPAIAARAALLEAQILASPLLRDSRAALTVLNAQWDALRADREAAGPAGWLRVELMLDLGLIDAASKALAELPDAGSPNSPFALLRLAEALAGRAADLPLQGTHMGVPLRTQSQADAQREVLRFTDRAMTMAVSDPATFRTVSERSARAMLAAGAIADAQRVLLNLLAMPEVQKDARACLDNSLALAEALERAGKPEESLKRLDGLAERYAGSVELHLARSRCLATLGRHDDSVAAARAARGLGKPGSEEWCRATLALAEGLAAKSHTAAAADILRVAGAMYPTFANAELRGKLKRLRENLEAQNARQGGTPAATKENPS
jgi:hypothetical protein